MKQAINYTEKNFFKELDPLNGIMTIDEFRSLMKRSSDSERQKLLRLVKSLENLEEYIVESATLVKIKFPNNDKIYEYEPPYFDQIHKLLELTDKYSNVKLDLNRLINLSNTHYLNNLKLVIDNTSIDNDTQLLNISDDAKANLEMDVEPVILDAEELNGISHLMASSDRLRAMSNQINNQYNFEDDAY